jgi:hypothetical protein
MGKLHRVVSDADIHEACLWRLADFPSDVLDASTLLVGKMIEGEIPLESQRPEVAAAMAALKRRGDRRNEWTALMAIAALYADSQGHARLFLLAGFEVLKASAQARRGSHGNRRRHVADALDAAIAEYLGDLPAATASDIFDSFADDACASHQVIVEHDRDKGELVCQLDPNDERLTNIGRGEFFKRVRKCATGCV